MGESEHPLRVMTFNMQVDRGDPPHNWRERRASVVAMLRRERPHLLATQEGLRHQVTDVQDGLGEQYAWTGEGREGGSRGEHMAVFHDRGRLAPVAHGHFWLSDTQQVAGSETWGGACPRMVTWVRFRDLATGAQFLLANTHFDHVSAYARSRSADLLAERLEVLAPAISRLVTGDFNTPAGDPEVHGPLLARASLVDSWEVAEQRGPAHGTFHDYRPPEPDGPRIDWILASQGTRVRSAAAVLPAPGDRAPSDHLPVTAVLHPATLP